MQIFAPNASVAERSRHTSAGFTAVQSASLVHVRAQ
jgi:hypothetical protein